MCEMTSAYGYHILGEADNEFHYATTCGHDNGALNLVILV